MKIIKTATCPTLTSKSKLTYKIGCDDDSKIHFRIHSNTGGGFFSDEWVAMDDVIKALGAVDGPITSIVLTSLFKGRSVNTPAFMMAVLKHEGLLEAIEGRQRCYSACDTHKFVERMKQLIEPGIAKKQPKKKSS